MKNKIKIFTVITLFLALFCNQIAYAETSTSLNPFKLEAFGIDTIAGFTAAIRSSQTLPEKTVIFTVQKPDGIMLTIPVESDEKGFAEFDLYDFHTKKAGEYKVWARLETGENGKYNTFLVYADEVSSMKSAVESSTLLVNANGLDKVYITVNLQDAHGNPIQGHSIEMISSRPDDTVKRVSEKAYTNEQGTIIFSASSISKGVSIYSFIDTTSNTVLSKRLEIAYTTMKNVGGDLFPTAFAAAGEASELKFSNLPAIILPNSDVSFTLGAYDSEGDLVPNYNGFVHFSVEGSNSIYASLPNDYTFDVDLDSGTHTFSGINSFNFSQEGTYTIVATDRNDFTIRGETEILVGTGTIPPAPGPDTTVPASDDEIVIQNPTPGIYSDGAITINGVAPVGLVVQVFDNDQNIGTTDVQADGTFSFQPSILQGGEHSIFVVGLDDGVIQSTSEEVTFTIDLAGPTLDDITFDPSTGIGTGDIINITVVSEADVFQGAVVFNVDIAELEVDPNDSTKYFASIQAPSEPGEYPVDVILVDELGNEGIYEGVAILAIGTDGAASLLSDDGLPDITGTLEPQPEEEPVYPSDVFGVRAVPSENRVTLKWQSATSDLGVDHYRILYGTSAANLDQIADTNDDAVTWYVPELENGTEYFFAIIALDTDDNESLNTSSIVSATPFALAPVVIEEPPVPETRPTAPTIQDSGPEIIWFGLISLFVTQLYFKFRKQV